MAEKKLRKCPICGHRKPAEEVYKRVDPYAHEIHGDNNKVLMCNDCQEQKLGDI